ncbi:MAG: TRAP transporter small permease subunit [Rhodospirillaceae bacterium]|nr:TRAP transporter small permease subunit [Rhodospirillaceae bacterium]MBT5245375.1 TRAP transporter small permease subunit [Rhodospirillaceae bacterium]MBT5562531.1 TRAP transporter small permease subunit [Rhodospirillaceae bacterium]MBT6242896.1 TRAP transporter small permease subunit [Rhodospirillaceae bacterium]
MLFIFNNFLIFWQGWPGVDVLFAHYGLLGMEPPKSPLEGTRLTLGWLQFFIYSGSIVASIVFVMMTRSRSMLADSETMAFLAAYIVRSAFWSILLIGIADITISFLRVEDFMEQMFGLEMTKELGRASYRGIHIHYPLIAIGFIIGLFTRSLGFIWLAFLIVLAELLIVITRFVFSYEQAFMGDLVRFWYAGLFLFASAYTLIEEGHVRVDILYTSFSDRGKAWSNAIGSLILGLPVCWIILIFGMWGKSNLINAPLLSYEVTQNGYGMFVKYLMAGFLMIYAVSMMVQFIGYFLSNASILIGEPQPPKKEKPIDNMNSGSVLLDALEPNEQKA